MSNLIDISPISDTAQMPVKKGTIEFLQRSSKTDLSQVLIGLISLGGYNFTTPYVLYGCINTGSGATYVISAGAIYYGGEIFLVDAASFTATGSDVAILSIITTQYTTNADPVTFTDTTVHNVHNIRKVLISAGASGSGIADYSAIPQLTISQVAIEQAARISADNILNGYIFEVLAAWTLRNNTADVVFTGGTGNSCSICKMKYIAPTDGKTMHLIYFITISNTTKPTSFTLAIPASKVSNVGFPYYGQCYVENGNAPSSRVLIGNGSPTIQFDEFDINDGQTQSFSGQLTFEIA